MHPVEPHAAKASRSTVQGGMRCIPEAQQARCKSEAAPAAADCHIMGVTIGTLRRRSCHCIFSLNLFTGTASSRAQQSECHQRSQPRSALRWGACRRRNGNSGKETRRSLRIQPPTSRAWPNPSNGSSPSWTKVGETRQIPSCGLHGDVVAGVRVQTYRAPACHGAACGGGSCVASCHVWSAQLFNSVATHCLTEIKADERGVEEFRAFQSKLLVERQTLTGRIKDNEAWVVSVRLITGGAGPVYWVFVPAELPASVFPRRAQAWQARARCVS